MLPEKVAAQTFNLIELLPTPSRVEHDHTTTPTVKTCRPRNVRRQPSKGSDRDPTAPQSRPSPEPVGKTDGTAPPRLVVLERASGPGHGGRSGTTLRVRRLLTPRPHDSAREASCTRESGSENPLGLKEKSRHRWIVASTQSRRSETEATFFGAATAGAASLGAFGAIGMERGFILGQLASLVAQSWSPLYEVLVRGDREALAGCRA